MRKIMAIGVVVLVASLSIMLVAKGLLDSATGKRRTAAVSTFTSKLERVSSDISGVVQSVPVVETIEAPTEHILSTEELRAAWDALSELWVARMGDEGFRQRRQAFSRLVYRLGQEENREPPLDEEEMERIQAFLEENDDVLQRVLELSQPGNPRIFLFEMLDYDPYYEFATLVEAHLLLAARTGESAAFHRDLQALIKLSTQSPYIRYPFGSTTAVHRAIDDQLAAGNVSDPAWGELDGALADVRQREYFVRTLVGVSRVMVEAYEQMPGGRVAELREQPYLHVQMWGYRYGLTALMNENLTRFTEVMGEVLELVPRPYYAIEQELERLREDYDIVRQRELGFFRRTPSEVGLSLMVGHWIASRAAEENAIALTRIAIALEQYRHEQGAYPDTLESAGLVLPRNALTGDPFHYVRTEERFALWWDYPREDGASIYAWPHGRFSVYGDEDIVAAIARKEAGESMPNQGP